MQIAVAGGRLGRDDIGRGDVQQEPVEIGQLQAVFIDAMIIGVAFEHELFGWRRGCVAPGIQCRQSRIFRAHLPRHLDMQPAPVIRLVFLDEFGEIFRSLIFDVELLHVGGGKEQPRR
ncbi:hypothetical protein D3C86_1357420 [compost metagenome]